MTPRAGKFPYREILPNTVGDGTLYPIGFTQQQAFDLRYNVHEINFTLGATSDNTITVAEAVAVMTTGQFQAVDVVGAILGDAFNQRGQISGVTSRWFDTGLADGVIHRFNQDLCMVIIDMSDVQRVQRSNLVDYYPKMLVLYYADGDVYTSWIQGSGGLAMDGTGVRVFFGETEIPSSITMYPATATAFPAIVDGVIKITAESDRYDNLIARKVSGNLEIEGMTFENERASRVQAVRVGNVYAASFSLSADKKKITAPIPSGCQFDNVVIETAYEVGSHTFTNEIIVPNAFKP